MAAGSNAVNTGSHAAAAANASRRLRHFPRLRHASCGPAGEREAALSCCTMLLIVDPVTAFARGKKHTQQ